MHSDRSPVDPRHWLSDRFDPKTGQERPSGAKIVPGIFHRRQGRSWAYYSTREGRKVTVVGGRQEAIDAKAKDAVAQAKHLPAPDRTSTIATIAAHCLEDARRRLRGTSSFESYEREQKLFVESHGHRKPGEFIGSHLLQDFVDDYAEGKITGKPRTSTSWIKVVLTDIFDEAARRLAVEASRSPVDLVRWPRKGRKTRRASLTRGERRSLLDALVTLSERPLANPAYAAVIATAAHTGLRIGEALALRVEDVDLLEEKITVLGTLNRRTRERGATKTDAGEREVPITGELLTILAECIDADADPGSFVFQQQDGRALSYHNVADAFESALKIAKLDDRGFTLHSLRHSAISALIYQGLSEADVAPLAGHSNAQTTRSIYAREFEDAQGRLDRARKALEAASEPVQLRVVGEADAA